MIIHDFKQNEQDSARSLVREFRDDQQKQWEELHPSLSETSRGARAESSTATAKEILVWETMRLHLEMGHAIYPEVLRRAGLEAIIWGRPNLQDLDDLRVQDLPACNVCEGMERILTYTSHCVAKLEILCASHWMESGLGLST